MSNWSAVRRAREHQEAARPRETKWNETFGRMDRATIAFRRDRE